MISAALSAIALGISRIILLQIKSKYMNIVTVNLLLFSSFIKHHCHEKGISRSFQLDFVNDQSVCRSW